MKAPWAKLIYLLLPAFCFALPALTAEASSCWVEDATAASQTVWLLCENGQILRRDQQGDAWQPQNPSSSQRLRAILALGPQRVFAIGDGGAVLSTEDSGISWKQVAVPVEERLTAIHFVGDHGWITGWNGTILNSEDGGRTWSRQISGVSSALESVYFTDANHGWAVGWVGTIVRTTDGGKTWKEVRSEEAKWSLNGVAFLDQHNGWAVGFAGLILRTRDGGLTWEEQSSPVKGNLTSITFDSESRGWVTTADGLVLSDDAGESWKSVPLGESLFLVRAIPRNGSVWAVGPRAVLVLDDTSQPSQKAENLHPQVRVGVLP